MKNIIIIFYTILLFICSVLLSQYLSKPSEKVLNQNKILMDELAQINIPSNTALEEKGSSGVHVFVEGKYITKFDYNYIYIL